MGLREAWKEKKTGEEKSKMKEGEGKRKRSV